MEFKSEKMWANVAQNNKVHEFVKGPTAARAGEAVMAMAIVWVFDKSANWVAGKVVNAVEKTGAIDKVAGWFGVKRKKSKKK